MKLDVFQHIVGTKNGIEVTEYTPVVHAHNESETGFLCSFCGFGDFGLFNHGGKYTPNYCPNCGAKMDEGESE